MTQQLEINLEIYEMSFGQDKLLNNYYVTLCVI